MTGILKHLLRREVSLVSGGNAAGLSGTWTNTSKYVFSQGFFESFSVGASCRFES